MTGIPRGPASAGKLPGVTRNTILYNIAFIFLGVVFEMGSAILINELRNRQIPSPDQRIPLFAVRL